MTVRTARRPGILAVTVVAFLGLAVPRGFAGGGGCPAGGAGLKCESKETQKHACECDDQKVKGCTKGASGGWLRIRATIAKLLKAAKKGDQAKIQSNLPKVDKDLGKVKAKVNKAIDRNQGTEECKQKAAELIDAFGVRVDETFDPGASTTTTTTLPGGGSLQGSGSISLFDPTGIIYDFSFNQDVTAFGAYVPGRSITNHLPPGLASCSIVTWTTEGDSTPDNYYECTGNLKADVHVTGNLRLSPVPASGMQIFLYGFQNGTRFGPFTPSLGF